MKKLQFQYSIGTLTRRLLHIASSVKGYIAGATIASIIGNLSHMGLMGFGAMLVLTCAGRADGSPLLYGTLMVLCGILIPVCRYLEGVVSHIGAYRLLSSMRISLFRTLRRLAPACLLDRQKGDLMNIAIPDIETLEFFFAHTIGPMFTVIILPCTTLLLAFHFNPLFAAVLLPIYIIISILIPLTAMKAGRSLGMRYRVSQGALKALVLESVYGIRDLQIFGHGPKQLQRVLDCNQEVNQAFHGLTLQKQAVTAAPTFFVYLARILILLIAARLTAAGIGNPTGTIVISFVATASFSSTFSLTTVVSSLLEAFAAAERVFLLEDAEPEVKEAAHPKYSGPIETIEFQDVCFRYSADGRQILDHFNLNIRKGDRIGIAGESGAGKSTVLRLLLRFWNPQSGTIKINGIPVQDLSLDELHQRIGMLEQDTFLFSGSIADNIALGRPDATRQQIEEAARQAGLHEFICTLPDGYDTQMGQMGARLSGGERQRVGIARVLLANPEVIVMDEPTSSLDVLHEKELLKTMEEVYADKTLLIVSHRPSTLSGCNRQIRIGE